MTAGPTGAPSFSQYHRPSLAEISNDESVKPVKDVHDLAVEDFSSRTTSWTSFSTSTVTSAKPTPGEPKVALIALGTDVLAISFVTLGELTPGVKSR